MQMSNGGRHEILALYGQAMLEAQLFEEALVGLLGVRGEVEAVERDEIEEVGDLDAWESLFTLPAGNVARQLGLAGNLGDQVRQGIEARNLLAHHYLRDWESRLDAPEYQRQMIEDLQRTIEQFRSIATAVEAERVDAMHSAGLTDDHLTIAGEARRLRNYDPAIDDDRPPHPFP
jgi:hypothetical protein